MGWVDHRKKNTVNTHRGSHRQAVAISYYVFKANCHRIVTAIDSAIDFEQFQDIPTLAEQLQGVDDIVTLSTSRLKRSSKKIRDQNKLTRRQVQSMRRNALRERDKA